MLVILYHPRAVRFLEKVSDRQKLSILSKIEVVANDFHSMSVDVKKLANTKRSYRLRVGGIRVIFEVDLKDNALYVHEIDFWGNIY